MAPQPTNPSSPTSTVSTTSPTSPTYQNVELASSPSSPSARRSVKRSPRTSAPPTPDQTLTSESSNHTPSPTPPSTNSTHDSTRHATPTHTPNATSSPRLNSEITSTRNNGATSSTTVNRSVSGASTGRRPSTKRVDDDTLTKLVLEAGILTADQTAPSRKSGGLAYFPARPLSVKDASTPANTTFAAIDNEEVNGKSLPRSATTKSAKSLKSPVDGASVKRVRNLGDGSLHTPAADVTSIAEASELGAPPPSEAPTDKTGRTAGTGALTWLKSTKEKMMPSRARFPAPLPMSDEDIKSLSAKGRAVPVDEKDGGGILRRALSRIDMGPRPPPKAELDDSALKYDLAHATPESVCRAMRAEEDIKRRIQRRRCLVWVCIWIAIMVVVVTAIMVPVFIKVIIPKMVTDNFANGKTGGSPFTVTEVSLGNFTERGSYANFSAYTGGVAVPFNIPIRLRENSTWTAKALVSPLNIVNGTVVPTSTVPEKEWTDMFRISPYLGGASILNGKMQTSSTGFFLEILNGGAAMASYVKGLSRLFVDKGDFVPLASIAIDGLVNVGTLEYWGLNLMRVLDIGKELGGTDLTAPGPGPMPNITALDFTVAGDRIRTGLRIDLDASNPTPLGFHLRNITFNLTLDGRPLAYCLIPELKFTAGSTTLTIPLEFFSYAPPSQRQQQPSPSPSPSPLSTSVPTSSLSLESTSSTTSTTTTTSSPSPRPTSLISDQIQVVLQTFDYRQAKLIGATNVTVLDEQMRRVQWLSLVASQINFEYPFQTLQGAAGSVVAGWILGIVLRSLGIST